MINRLQALELHGYKTFANKTHFAFPGQVTAIVGPNGSGKSNIADSIRWVLGEQAYSVLRGKRTVDMIFSGSEQRSRASMASVSITFDNQNGWLPVDFSEVSITRRAYRDGDNEYLLNNQRVRLKEINELLANSGLGDRTYTIIGQGLVDTALSLRPDERRKFFEEAAGIGLYRDRREEAVQKLDKTLRNMERARDLVAELKPRIATLLRNKEKATHYKQIQNDLNLLLKDWYGFHWHQIQKELAFASDFFNHQKTEFQKIQIEKEKLEEQLNKIQANLNENRLELADLHKELAVFHTETEEITRKIAVLDEREKALRLRLSEVSGEIANNAEQESYIQSELTGLESIALRYKNEFKEVTELLKISNEKLGKKNREQEEIERQLKEIRTKILSSESQLLNFENTQNTYLREIQSKKDEIKKISEYLASVASSIQEIDKLRKENLGDLEKQNTSILMLESDQKSNLEELAKNQNIINKYIDKKQQTEALISRISAELEVISDAEEHLAGFNSGSGEIISASRSKLVPGKISLILDQIDIPEKYEIAIASVLGEILEGILLDSGSHTVEILDYLEKQKITRTVFIPCDLKISKKPQHPFNSKQLFFADSLISKEAAFSTVIKNLLSRTIIADSREEAINLFPELQPGWKIATLTGEIFDSLGTISAGIEYRAKPLKRKREKAELLVELSKQKMNIEEIGLAISSFKEKGEVIKNKAVSISNEIKSFNEKIATLSFENRKLELEKEQKERVHREESNRLKSLDNVIKGINSNLDSLMTKKLSEEQKIKELQIDSGRFSNIDNSQEIDDLRKEVIEYSSRKTVSEKLDQQHAQSLLKTQENFVAIRNVKENLKNKLSDLKINIAETVSTKEELYKQKEIIRENIEAIIERINPLEEKVEVIIGAQGKILEDVDKGRRDFAIMERHTLQSQLKVEKIRGQITNIKEKIEEDFGILNEGADLEFGFDQPLPMEGLMATLPRIDELPEGFEDQISQKKTFLRRVGPINPEAEKEFDEANERFSFLNNQLIDLEKAEKDLRQVVSELDLLMKKEFMRTFKKVEVEFSNIFGQLFNGGTAKLYLEDEENILDGGIEIEATLPGRRKQELGLLSGGERSLTAVALIFALLKISPTPFCILDEVDAMLDESNVVRFGELLSELSDTTQFIVITHNRNTVQLADVLYGVTMGKDSVSQVISLRMDELTDEMVQ